MKKRRRHSKGKQSSEMGKLIKADFGSDCAACIMEGEAGQYAITGLIVTLLHGFTIKQIHADLCGKHKEWVDGTLKEQEEVGIEESAARNERYRQEVEAAIISSPRPEPGKEPLFPSYRELLDYLCRETGIPGSPSFYEAVMWLKKRTP